MRVRAVAVGLWVASNCACSGDVTVSPAPAGHGGAGGFAKTASSGMTTATASMSSATGTTGSTTSSSAGGTGGSDSCGGPCPFGLKCCNGVCVNKVNDFLNCGQCGLKCTGAHPFCDGDGCGIPACYAKSCTPDQQCCGTYCCAANELCCFDFTVGPGKLRCWPPTQQGSCPPGCPDCSCAAPNTPVATPNGERPIAEIREGDLVLSVHQGRIAAVPVRATRRKPVSGHRAVRVTLEGGRTILISADHPLADGGTVGQLRAGDRIHGVQVVASRVVPYPFDVTYDILPASDTGTYFAAGALVGSTLFGPVRVPEQCFSLPRLADDRQPVGSRSLRGLGSAPVR